MRIYRELGERVERDWDVAGRDPERFAAIAAEALREARIPERSSAEEVLAWVFESEVLPPQNDLAEAFGEPPVTVHRGDGFHVEVLFWVSTVTTVHDHGFSGAFQALSGERLQTRHRFEASGEAVGPARLGRVLFTGAEVLAPGDVAEITHDLVHAIVHMEEPSATIVVRTASDADAGPQLDYLAPWVARDAFHVDEARTRKLGALRLLCRTDERRGLERAAEIVARSDLATCLGVLGLVHRGLGAEAHVASVIDAATARHGAEVIDRVLEVLREERRLRAAHALRARTRDADARFLLALLHHVPCREDALELVAARSPGVDPREKVMEILDGLSGTDRIGVDMQDEPTREIVRAMLRAGTPAEVRRALAEVYDADEVEARREVIDGHAAKIRRTVLAPLFRPRREGGA